MTMQEAIEKLDVAGIKVWQAPEGRATRIYGDRYYVVLAERDGKVEASVGSAKSAGQPMWDMKDMVERANAILAAI